MKKFYRLTLEEQETYLHLNALDDTVQIETSIPKDIKETLIN